MWSDIGGLLISPVHKAMFATQTILNTPKLNREAAKIGQTCEATSEAQCEDRLYTRGCLQQGGFGGYDGPKMSQDGTKMKQDGAFGKF